MSDGNTMIGNAIVVHDKSAAGTNQDETYLAVDEENALEQAEDKMMEEEIPSEDEEAVEHQMLTAAIVNSVVETAATTDGGTTTLGEGGTNNGGGSEVSQQRYSLRKRRRPTGEDGAGTPSPSKKKPTVSAPNIPPAPTLAAPNVQPDKAKAAPPNKPPSPSSRESSIQHSKVQPEAVPACTVAAPLAAPLHAGMTLPNSSSLPLALQPPSRPNLPPLPPSASSAANNRMSRSSSKSSKDGTKTKRLAPPARVALSSTSKPLTPNPIGVPNPLSNPLPASKSILVSKQQQKVAGASSFMSDAKLTVPCPLPLSSFEQSNSNPNNIDAPTSAPPAESAPASELPVQEKKRVTIAPEAVQSRGRIFSIDLDPASLDFSVLDSGESGTPAPASADLPLVTGGGRDRAFSFECFAFGINADEPLPPLSEHGGNGCSYPGSHFSRPRGDSIIFDPVSFQEGGIHEEHALTTRESRGMSIELDAVIMSAVASHEQDMHHTGSPADVCSYAPHVSSSCTAPVVSEDNMAGHRHSQDSHMYPDNATSHGMPPPAHVPSHLQPNYYSQSGGQPSIGHSHPPPPSIVPSNPLPHQQDMGGQSPSGSAVSTIIGSCASSTTLQMELLNKDGRIGIYLPEARKERIARFHAKRKMRIWRKRIKYDCRKKLADSRPRIKGRFVKRADMD